MRLNHTDITIVLDRSGSMRSVADDTIGGFNSFLADQKAAPGTADITLYQFDTDFDTVFKARNVQEAPDLNMFAFNPRGNTALLDAIGRAITETGSRLSTQPAEKVVFVIITDGEENSSREFTAAKVLEMIEHQRSKYSWEFVFLGANQDAIAAASSFGIAPANAMTYAHNAVGTQSAFASTSANLTQMRAGRVDTMAYTQADKDAQTKAGL